MQTVAIDAFDVPILARIHQITLPTPFPVGPVHTYLVEGEPLTLVDTGPHTPEAWDALQRHLQALGYAASDIERIILTHAHSDHFGLVGKLAEISGAEVAAYPLAQPLIEGWNGYYEQRNDFWTDILALAGVPGALAEPTARLYRSFRLLQTHTPVTRLLDDGSVIDMAGVSWQVLYCPGHSSNLICFYQPDNRLLIGNDHLLAHISSNAIIEPPPHGETVRRKSLIDYWRALCRVNDMDIALVLPGHGEPVPNHRWLISQRFDFYQRRLARLRAQIALGPHTVWQLAEALFRRLDNVDVFLAISEVMGHLDVLEEGDEAVSRRDDSGVLRYEAAP